MPRPSAATDALVAELTSRLERLVAPARDEGRKEALGEIRRVLAEGGVAAGRRAPGVRAAPPAPRKASRRGRSSASGRPRRSASAALPPAARLA